MPLHDFQLALGRMIRENKSGIDPQAWLPELNLHRSERQQLQALKDSAGMRFAIEVQRSWCEGRARNSAYLALSNLPREEQQELVDQWVDCGGGTSSFFVNEAEDFLEFIADHLPLQSHSMSICRMQQAIHRAEAGTDVLSAVQICTLALDATLYRSRSASLVYFFAEPDEIFTALERGDPMPPIGDEYIPLLFAPGIPNLFEVVNELELAIWDRLAHPAAMNELLDEGHHAGALGRLLLTGACAVKSVPVDLFALKD
jgi:hypothetical protein